MIAGSFLVHKAKLATQCPASTCTCSYYAVHAECIYVCGQCISNCIEKPHEFVQTRTPVHSVVYMFIVCPIPLLMLACNSQTQQSVGFVAVLSYWFYVPLISLHTQQVLVVQLYQHFKFMYQLSVPTF